MNGQTRTPHSAQNTFLLLETSGNTHRMGYKVCVPNFRGQFVRGLVCSPGCLYSQGSSAAEVTFFPCGQRWVFFPKTQDGFLMGQIPHVWHHGASYMMWKLKTEELRRLLLIIR